MIMEIYNDQRCAFVLHTLHEVLGLEPLLFLNAFNTVYKIRRKNHEIYYVSRHHIKNQLYVLQPTTYAQFTCLVLFGRRVSLLGNGILMQLLAGHTKTHKQLVTHCLIVRKIQLSPSSFVSRIILGVPLEFCQINGPLISVFNNDFPHRMTDQIVETDGTNEIFISLTITFVLCSVQRILFSITTFQKLLVSWYCHTPNQCVDFSSFSCRLNRLTKLPICHGLELSPSILTITD